MNNQSTKLKGLSLALFIMFAACMLSPAKVQAETTQEYVMRFLVNDVGMTPAGACGVMANMALESGFNPAIRSWAGALGLCQWAGVRRGWLFNYCASNGYSAESAEGQMHYLLHELNTIFPGVLAAMRSIPNTAAGAYNAGYIWCMRYESAGNPVSLGNYRAGVASGTYWPAYGAPMLYLTVGSTDGGVKVQWNGSNKYGYAIKRAAKRDGKYTVIAKVESGTNSYKDKTAKKSKEYFYCVARLNKDGKEEQISNKVRATAKMSVNDKDCSIALDEYDWDYTGKAVCPKVSVLYNGKKLKKDKHYRVSYAKNIKPGEAKITLTGIGEYSGSTEIKYTILKSSRNIKAEDLSIVWKKAVTVEPKITMKDQKTASYKLTSSNKKVVVVKGGKLNIVGSGSAVITLKVKSTDTYRAETVKFRVNACPDGQQIKVVSAPGSNALQINWKKDKNASGYEILCSENSKFDEPVKQIIVPGNANLSAMVTELTAGTEMYVKVRSYAGKDKFKAYGAWSKTEKVMVQ